MKESDMMNRGQEDAQHSIAASVHEWDGGYPYRSCRRCKTLDLGKPTECRGWYYGDDGERVYPDAQASPAARKPKRSAKEEAYDLQDQRRLHGC